MPDAVLVLIAATFLLAGSVKGVIGLGLPTVSLALLTVATDLPTAMALLLVPSFVTNLWQAAMGGRARVILLRLWPFLLLATASVWIGAGALTRVDLSLLSALLGLLLVAYAGVSIGGLRVSIPSRHEPWIGPLAGFVNGVLTGMTGSFVVPGVIYLQSLELDKNELIQAMGILFTLSTLALALALQGNSLLSVELGIYSALAVVPACVGMIAGQAIRNAISEALFRKVFFISLLALGAYIMARALGGAA